MKQLAIIGSSSVVMRGGYGHLIKHRLGAQCDLYGLGSSSIVWSLFALLKEKIAGKYKHVAIQFNPIDGWLEYMGVYSLDMAITILLGIINLIQGSSSTLLFISFPTATMPAGVRASSILKAVAGIFNIRLIDLYKVFRFISRSQLVMDHTHLKDFYSEYAAQAIIDVISQEPLQLRPSGEKVKFELLVPDNSNLQSSILGTSLMRGPVYHVGMEDTIIIPSDRFLAGIHMYIDETAPPLLLYQNESIKLSRSLDTSRWRRIYQAWTVGHSIRSGLKGGCVSICANPGGTIYEKGHDSQHGADYEGSPLYLHSLLVCNAAPVEYGAEFRIKNWRAFLTAMEEIESIQLSRVGIQICAFWPRLEELAPDTRRIFQDILNGRPDLEEFIGTDRYQAERLILWAWTYGRNEYPELSEAEGKLGVAMSRIYLTPYFIGDTAISLLIYMIKSLRKDLDIFDLQKAAHISALYQWFSNHGKAEYGLQDINLFEPIVRS